MANFVEPIFALIRRKIRTKKNHTFFEIVYPITLQLLEGRHSTATIIVLNENFHLICYTNY